MPVVGAVDVCQMALVADFSILLPEHLVQIVLEITTTRGSRRGSIVLRHCGKEIRLADSGSTDVRH